MPVQTKARLSGERRRILTRDFYYFPTQRCIEIKQIETAFTAHNIYSIFLYFVPQ